MKDLTNNPIGGHILQMAAPIAAGMFFQTLYFLIDLYFVGRQHDPAGIRESAAGSRRVSQPAGNSRFGAAGIGLRSRN
jgi:Na+-driven multidrug efflux pump